MTKRSLFVVLVVGLLAAGALLWWSEATQPPAMVAPLAATATEPSELRSEPPPEGATVRTAVRPNVAAAAPAAATLRGRVLQDRRPLADVTVYAMSSRMDRTVLAQATSAADGTFAIAVGRDSCWLALAGASVPRGFRAEQVAGSPIDRDAGDVHVPHGAIVTGIVRDVARQPVAGAQVSIAHAPRPPGPTEELDAAPVVTDADGRFRIERVHPGRNRVNAHADGDGGFVDIALAAGEAAEVAIALVRGQAPRQATVARRHVLRGTVRGHAGGPTSVHVGKTSKGDFSAKLACRDSWPAIEVPVRGGSFATELCTDDYFVVAWAEGVGMSAPVEVALQDDASVELAIVPHPSVAIDVRDGNGAHVGGVELIAVRPEANVAPWFLDETAERTDRILGGARRFVVAAPDARASLSVDPALSLAFAVRAPGFVTTSRAFAAGDVPARVDVVLQRAANVRGVVRNGDRVAYASSVLLWRTEDDERMRTQRRPAPGAERFAPLACSVDAAGRFAIDDVAPGTYRAALSRYGRSRTDHRPDEQVGAVALVDEDVDWRSVVEFAVHGGADTHVELIEPRLGTLRGRVLRAGQPFTGALVVATRAGWRPHTAFGGATDWDDTLDLGQAGGQRTADDGSFTFLYRDAGDVEIRVRHPNGDATSNPTIVKLPLPGADVECVVTMPGAVLRGRFPLEQLPAIDRGFTTAVLFPLHKAADDPYASWDWHAGLVYDCARVELKEDGRFAFESLPAGDFVLRVYAFEFNGGRTLWQRVITIGDAPIELGDLAPPKLVGAQFTWKFETAPSAEWGPVPAGVQLLRAHGENPAAVWVAAFPHGDGNASLEVEPGRYTLRPIDAWGRHGSDRVVEVAADGAVTPGVVTFPPRPQKEGAPR